jgi:hypothetical protein
MRQYKIIARIVLILPIINFAFALPIAEQETRQVGGGVVPDVAITMSAKRGDEVPMNRPYDIYFERLDGKDSDLAGLKGLQPETPDHGSMNPPQTGTSEIQPETPDHGSMNPPQTGTSEIQPASPSLSKSSSEASLPESEASFPTTHDYPVLADPKSGAAMAKPESKSFLSEMVSKLRLWRRISGPVSVRDAVNAAQKQLQGLVDTGAYVFASFPRVTIVLTL